MKSNIGVAFYSKQIYQQLLKMADDRENLPDTYRDRQVEYKHLRDGMRNLGVHTEPFEMNLQELRLWLLQNDLPNTGASRSRFVSEKMQERDQNKN